MVEKSWVHLNRADPRYERGAWNFVKSVGSALGENDMMIICPCIDCRNVDHHSAGVVVDHLVTRGMDWSYKMREDWYHHGEVISGSDCGSVGTQWNKEILGLYQAAELLDEELVMQGDLSDVPEGEDKQEDDFLAKLADAETPLYPNCENHSKLSAIVSLYRLKTQSGWSDRSFDLLWKSILARFDVDEGYKKTVVFTQMNSLWRASKSRLVTKVREASTLKERMSLQPKNVSTSEWRKFVKEKTSNAFKVVSDSYKERRQKQIPHTCGRKGMVRLREELVKNSTELSKVTRLKVWVKSHTRKDGTPVNVNAAEKIKLAAELDSEGPQDSTTTNPKADMLTQILGPDNPGRLRAMGRGMSLTKLSFLELNNNCMAAMEEKQIHLQKQVENLQQVIAKMNNQQREEPDVGENSINKSVNTGSLPKCLLVDWCSTDETVAEGRVVSYDTDEIVNGIPLGPNSVKVLVESAIKPEAFLWRPAHEMFTVEDAVGEMVAWQVDYCIVPTAGFIPEDIAPKSPSTSSKNRCELMDYIKNDEVVAEGRWQSQEPKALVNGLPLGPNAIKIYVDKVLNPTAYIWRPTVDMRTMEDSLNHFVAWLANRVVIDTTTPTPSTSKAVSRSSQNKNSPVTPAAPLKKPAAPVKKPAAPVKKPAASLKASSPFKKPAASLKASSPLKKPAASLKASSPRRTSQRLAFKENQKCKLLDLSGNKRVVAEGRWSSNNPDQVVHFVPLGPGACRVWVDVVKVLDAAVWRKSSGIEYMEDAIGSVLAWPADKVVME